MDASTVGHTLSPLSAVKQYLELNSTQVPNMELIKFWKGLTAAEKTEYSEGAARMVGCTLVTA